MTITEKATEALRDALLQGVFGGATKLTEKAACDYLGISRTPVRAALQALAQEGLLSHAPQRHYRIRTFTPKDIGDAYAVRAALEGLACGSLRAGQLTPVVADVLRDCVALGDALLADPPNSFDHVRWRDMNVRLHSAILDAAGNATLTSAVRHAEKVPLATMTVIADWGAEPDFDRIRGAQTDHRQIVASLIAGDFARAEARMREHILVAGELVVKGIAESGRFGPHAIAAD